MTRAAAELEVMLEAPLAEAVGRVLTTGRVLEAADELGDLTAGALAAGGAAAGAAAGALGAAAGAVGANGTPTAILGASGVPTATLGATAEEAAGAEQAVEPMAVSTIGEQLFCTPVRVW